MVKISYFHLDLEYLSTIRHISILGIIWLVQLLHIFHTMAWRMEEAFYKRIHVQMIQIHAQMIQTHVQMIQAHVQMIQIHVQMNQIYLHSWVAFKVMEHMAMYPVIDWLKVEYLTTHPLKLCSNYPSWCF